MTLKKKREILPHLDKVIAKLVSMAPECAKLEYTDNDQASRRIKRSITELKNNELKEFTEFIFDLRAQINSIPSRKKTNANQSFNLKKTNNHEQSTKTMDSGSSDIWQ